MNSNEFNDYDFEFDDIDDPAWMDGDIDDDDDMDGPTWMDGPENFDDFFFMHKQFNYSEYIDWMQNAIMLIDTWELCSKTQSWSWVDDPIVSPDYCFCPINCVPIKHRVSFLQVHSSKTPFMDELKKRNQTIQHKNEALEELRFHPMYFKQVLEYAGEEAFELLGY